MSNEHVSNVIFGSHFNDIFIKAIAQIKEKGKWTNPRGFHCKELIASQLVLENPENCLITFKERGLNYAYLTIEKFMYLSKFQDPDIMVKYNSKMADYINPDTGRFDGAYGDRIAKGNQLEWCYEELKKDPDSRRAVVMIHDYTDCNHDTKDSTCTLSLHFMIRDGKLDLITTMRSNDILWGTCLDVPAFCFLQEVMAYWLGIPVGRYIHQASSLHFYDTVEQKIDKVFYGSRETLDKVFPKWTVSFEETKEALEAFWKAEKSIRQDGGFMLTGFETIDDYLLQLKEYWDIKLNRYDEVTR